MDVDDFYNFIGKHIKLVVVASLVLFFGFTFYTKLIDSCDSDPYSKECRVEKALEKDCELPKANMSAFGEPLNKDELEEALRQCGV